MIPKIADVRGVGLDPQTRCRHYHGPSDIIAIKMKCCGVYYACKDCHQALANHPAKVWPRAEWDEKAVLCGSCGAELTILQYMQSGYQCPECKAQFNPACQNHYHYYFAV
ncbi:MAG TPA: CHY zinc finger protein [Terriglobales bacterium]|nr:CHY zinc finger protein [Terriglobales bacterium]